MESKSRKRARKDEEESKEEKKETKMTVEGESSEGEYESESEDKYEEEEVVEDRISEHSSDYEEEKEGENTSGNPNKIRVTLWDETKKLNANEKLDFDNNAYEMLHRSKIEWPCLSIDFIIPENFNKEELPNFYKKKDQRVLTKDDYPYSAYMIAGSQTNEPNGFVYCMKWYNMYKTKYDDDPEKCDSDDEGSQNPYMKYQKVKIKGNVNRIKSMKNSYLNAVWTDNSTVEILNISELLNDLDQQVAISTEEENEKNASLKKRKITTKNIVAKTFTRPSEGFALDWNNFKPGILAAGGLDKIIENYSPTDENCSDFIKQDKILKGHSASVEDIQWSPEQEYVLASASVDKSIKLWDLRTDCKNSAITIPNAHDSDVNVISWNQINTTLLASGGDDNIFKVWDLKMISNGIIEPIAKIKWHRAPICSLMWDPNEDSQLAVCSEDDRLSVWDFSVEKDDKQIFDNYNEEIPEQLVFLHQGQKSLKDVKFHPYFKNVLCSTAENGINLFKPAFDEDSESESDEEMAD